MCRHVVKRRQAAPERRQRLTNNVKVLYHVTDGPVTSAVLHKRLLRGPGGHGGHAIYCYASAAAARATMDKPNSVVLRVTVKLGKVKEITSKRFYIFSHLAARGYDSVSFETKAGKAYAVYCWDQADVIGYEADSGTIISEKKGHAFPAHFETKVVTSS